MTKRRTALLLAALLMMLSAVSAAQGEPRELVMANPTRLGGHFFTDLWGSNSADMDVRFLVHGQGTVAYLKENRQAINPSVVREFTREADEEGNVTYAFTLFDDLRFSDGSAVSARDFAGSVLLQAGPHLKAVSGAPKPAYTALLGQEEYFLGFTETLEGLRLLDEHRFSLTISADALPNYNELSLVDVLPYPFSVLVQDNGVLDSGLGAGFEKALSEEDLRAVLLGEDGYLSHPKVSFGPYVLTGFDAQSGEAELTRNPHYKGDNLGQKPQIERIRLIEARNETMMDQLKQGEIDLINKITWNDAVVEARSLQREGLIRLSAYSRRGLAYLAVNGQEGPTSSLLLRKALASLINREELIREALQTNGTPVYGLYGIGEGMAAGRETELAGMLHLYPFSLKNAEAFLKQDGWVLDAKGQSWLPGSGSLRHKQDGADLRPLTLSLAISRDNPIARAAAGLLQARFDELGGEIRIAELNTNDLFLSVYRRSEEAHDLTFMGSNFGLVYDPGDSLSAVSGVTDPDLDTALASLKLVSPWDSAAYRLAWDHFQRSLVAALPIIPLYSNLYFDAYSADLLNYQPAGHFSGAYALLYAKWK